VVTVVEACGDDSTAVHELAGNGMKVLQDFQGLAIRLTDERLAHILEHPEMVGMEAAIEETLLQPNRVMASVSDPAARLYYRFYVGTMVGDKIFALSSR
jgi:hypothetical protein